MTNALIFCCDANYFWPAALAANRVAALCPQRDFDIRIFCSDPVPDSFPRHAAAGVRAETLSLGDFRFDRDLANRISVAAFLRVAAIDHLSASAERVVYYDVDVAFRHGDLSRLFRLDLRGKVIGAVRDSADWGDPGEKNLRYFASLGVSRQTGGYFNSGFLLVDTTLWKGQNIGPQVLRFAADHPDLCRFNDQSALNHVLRGQWAELSPTWNWQAGKPHPMLLVDTRDPCVVHFNSRQKPWRDGLRTIPAAFKDPFRDWGRQVGWTLPEDNDVLSPLRPRREAVRAEGLAQAYATLPDWVRDHQAYLARTDFIDMAPDLPA